MWQPGENVALRGMYNHRPWYVQSVLVVKDAPTEVVLALLPGAECAAPSEYIHGKHGDSHHWDRWELVLNNSWRLERYYWRTNRFLIFLEPGKFYASIYMWNHANDEFLGYYINFQLPFSRSACGFDTFDLELDLVVDPALRWRWKDVAEYQRGIESGGICAEWVQGIEQAQKEVFDRLERRFLHPFDGSWLQWRPDPARAASRLPDGWEEHA
jgi:protein associated with RNAse G/E